VAHTTLPAFPPGALYWHIDTLTALPDAGTLLGPSSAAVRAHGSAWMLTVESQTNDYHGGTHAASVGPLPVPAAPSLMMQIMN
jgi:hypothetical protein